MRLVVNVPSQTSRLDCAIEGSSLRELDMTVAKDGICEFTVSITHSEQT
jgi:hypothetical protein